MAVVINDSNPGIPGAASHARGGIDRTRRDALLSLAVGGLATLAGLPAAAQAPHLRAPAFAAFLDTLLPADDFGPSASALGVDREIMGFAPSGSPLYRLLALGTQWLDGLDARAFADLPAATRQEVLGFMQQSDENEIPGRFFRIVRQYAMHLYHTHLRARVGLPLNPAPQPVGYPPPWV